MKEFDTIKFDLTILNPSLASRSMTFMKPCSSDFRIILSSRRSNRSSLPTASPPIPPQQQILHQPTQRRQRAILPVAGRVELRHEQPGHAVRPNRVDDRQ